MARVVPSARTGSSLLTEQEGRRATGTDPAGEQALSGQLWHLVANPLSSAAMRMRSLRSQLTDDPVLARQLDELIRDLDLAFGAVLRAPACPGPDHEPRGEHDDGGPQHTSRASDEALAAFAHWVGVRCPELLPAGSGGGGQQPDDLLGLLSAEPRPVRPSTARTLGLPPGSSHAQASGLLVWARHTADGPRCRSYRSALYFLASSSPEPVPAPAPGTS
jgi:hypothetical protein